MLIHQTGYATTRLHNMADQKTIGLTKVLRLAEKTRDKTVKSEVSKKKVTERKWENISLQALNMPLRGCLYDFT